MRRVAAVLAGVAALSGCGVGPGEERDGDGVELRVTRDFGRKLLSQRSAPQVRKSDTVMRLLRSRNKVDTRFGGRFVQSIDGLAGRGPGGSADWFFYVNGIAADKGAAEYELSPGDVVQWDYRDWRETMDVRAIVGAFPEPFVHGEEGKRLAVRVECEDEATRPCRRVKDRLRRAGAPATGGTLGASGSRNVIRVVVARWARARELPSARLVEQGPRRSGVFARFRSQGRTLELLDERGDRARTAGPGAGLVAATAPREEELLWLVTGTDEAGLARAARALDPRTLRDAFAVAVGPQGVERLPVAAR
jgi:hypothetical protein